MEDVQLITTDITQPSKPGILVDNTGRNGFTVKWEASRDSVGDAGDFTPGPSPNFNILSYRLTRLLLRDSTAKTTGMDKLDSIIVIDMSTNGKQDTFRVEMRFLPPGTRFHLRLTALDNSGFASITDTMTLSTEPVRFAGSDSALECPAGFIPIPRGIFKFGDDEAAAANDEKPGKATTMAPYCIEPYEHRDSTGKRFVSNVTYQQAADICAELDTSFSTQLCSEAEWERACEGADSVGLLHGIQSEGNNPTILQASCNQGTNDSAMAMSFDLRNSICLTTEGVYDMAGNLSEWVRDPYVANAYGQRKDTLDHSFSFVRDSSDVPRRYGLRGGNYLKTKYPQLSLTQNLARCSNRDFAAQVRPVYREECKDETKRKVAVIYGSGLAGHRCVDIDTLTDDGEKVNPDMITEITPDFARLNQTARLPLRKKGLPYAKTLSGYCLEEPEAHPRGPDHALPGRGDLRKLQRVRRKGYPGCDRNEGYVAGSVGADFQAGSAERGMDRAQGRRKFRNKISLRLYGARDPAGQAVLFEPRHRFPMLQPGEGEGRSGRYHNRSRGVNAWRTPRSRHI